MSVFVCVSLCVCVCVCVCVFVCTLSQLCVCITKHVFAIQSVSKLLGKREGGWHCMGVFARVLCPTQELRWYMAQCRTYLGGAQQAAAGPSAPSQGEQNVLVPLLSASIQMVLVC